jgi:hypothetical protein
MIAGIDDGRDPFRKWAKRVNRHYGDEKYMPNNFNPNREFFYLDDMSNDRTYNSVSVGALWLYFYKETLIGIRDMRTNDVAFLEVKERLRNDGHSHRHEIDGEVIKRAMDEAYPTKSIKMVGYDELCGLAIQWTADSIAAHISNALKP